MNLGSMYALLEKTFLFSLNDRDWHLQNFVLFQNTKCLGVLEVIQGRSPLPHIKRKEI
jgi:hypothetical protein